MAIISLMNWIMLHPVISTAVGLGGVLGASVLINDHFSTENIESTYLFKEVPACDDSSDSKCSELLDNKTYESLTSAPHSYRKLLDGDKSYSGGNYIIYYGSEACIHCTGFLFGDQSISDGSLSHHRDKMSDGTWMKAYESTQKDEVLKKKNIKFLMFEDIPDTNLTGRDSSFWSLPWARWPQDDHSKGRVRGEYIRNDKSAKDFRRMFQAAQEKFGEKVAGTPTIILYKEGRPVVYGRDELPDFKMQQQDESLSDELSLKQFIKYYYTQVKV